VPRRAMKDDEPDGGPTSGPMRSGAKSSGKKKREKPRARFSPYKKPTAAPTPGPGPATLMSEMELGPISARTRAKRAHWTTLPPPPVPAAAQQPTPVSAAGDPGTSGGSGPLERQVAKEDRWRQKLDRQATWWDSAALAITEKARTAELHLGEASRAAAKSARDSSLRTLLRARNHAKADVKEVEQWRNAAMDKFLGNEKVPAAAPPAPPQRPEPPSPDHFERLYGPRRSLPPLRMATRGRVADGAAAARERETRNAATRAAVFNAGSR
jgi:hypothetical protein